MSSSLRKSRCHQFEHLNESFRAKTEKVHFHLIEAIQLINKHQEQKFNFLKTLNTNKKLLQNSSFQEDQKFFSIVEIPEIYIQENFKVQLLPATDKIYKILNPFYPLENKQNSKEIKEENEDQFEGKISMRDSNERTMSKREMKNRKQHFDKSLLEQNGNQILERDCKMKILIKNYRGATTELFLYFQNSEGIRNLNYHYQKFLINNEKIININLEDFRNKKWIYVRVKSQKQLSMFTMRLQKENSIRKRIVTDISEIASGQSKQILDRKLSQLKTSISLKSMKSINIQSQNSLTLKKQRSDSLKLLGFTEQKSVNYFSPSSKKQKKEILQRLKKQQTMKKKQQQQKKQVQIAAKKNAVEQARQIELKLKSKALQMKRLVEQYKLIHEEQRKQIKQLHPKIAALMFIPQFNKICRQMIFERERGMDAAWKTRALTKKFVKIMKNKYRESIQSMKSRKYRQQLGVMHLTALLGKMLYKNNIQKSEDVFMSTVHNCQPGLILNQSFDHATIYRRSIRCIQRWWLNQYNAKMQMFQMYIKKQASSLMTKYPYFKYINGKFMSQNVAHFLAYKYISEESSKIRFLFDDYRQKLKEIEEFKEMNRKIADFNKTALKKNQKPYLQVPKKPCYPSPRYFRNISFLKSMIRSWFELEYRKWSKVNKTSIKSLVSQKLSTSPEKLLVNRSSINSVDLSSFKKENN